jgi:hypothetical protein
MGRGIIESGLFRSERYGFELRTTDPANHSEGEMWIRTDVAPDTDQLATLRFDNGSGTWDIPIYDAAASVNGVSKAQRIPIGGTTGFIPLVENGGVFDPLRLQHNGVWYGAHDSLSAIPDSGVSRWEFDDDSDTTTAIDSWSGYDGSINGASYITDSYEGGAALSFDGTDDYVSVGTNADLEEGTTFSCSVWIRTNASVGNSDRYIGKQEGSGNFYGWWLTFDPNSNRTARFSVRTSDTGTDTRIAGTTALNDGVWHHVVGAYDANGDQVLYVDGSSENSAAADGGTASTTASMEMGRREDGSYPYPGDVDDARFYDKALSSAEVQNLYDTGSISG